MSRTCVNLLRRKIDGATLSILIAYEIVHVIFYYDPLMYTSLQQASLLRQINIKSVTLGLSQSKIYF